jgi:hypothetical protein
MLTQSLAGPQPASPQTAVIGKNSPRKAAPEPGRELQASAPLRRRQPLQVQSLVDKYLSGKANFRILLNSLATANRKTTRRDPRTE